MERSCIDNASSDPNDELVVEEVTITSDNKLHIEVDKETEDAKKVQLMACQIKVLYGKKKKLKKCWLITWSDHCQIFFF